MEKSIMVGCDLHERSMLLLTAAGPETPQKRSFRNTPEGRAKMIAYLRQRAQDEGAAGIVFVYEASSLGFGLYDELMEAGISGHVLAPTKMERSPHHNKNKTDEKDARAALKALRSHLLGGEDLPDVWVPDHQTRADRALVRQRLRVGEKIGTTKTEIQSWLKVHGQRRPKHITRNWRQPHRQWLQAVAAPAQSGLQPTALVVLESLLRQLDALETEAETLEQYIVELAQQPRYAEPVRELQQFIGIAVLSAMVFLTEMGDLTRFQNRRQIGAYLGLVPSTHESGQVNDRKGHITRQGPARVRKILCQAVWVRIRHDEATHAYFENVMRRAPKRKKVYVVAHMRKLAIRLWHRGREAQVRAGSYGPDSARTT